MFETHQAKIGAYAQRSPENMARVLTFVVLTIRQPLHRVPADMETVYNSTDHDEISGILFGHKAAAWASIDARRDETYRDLMVMWEDGTPHADMLAYLAKRPGLGLVKAGFALQLIFGIVGCLDTHNLTRYGIPENRFNASKGKAKRYETRLGHAQTYVETCEALGGCQSLWDTWCTYVATNQPDTYRDPEHVSELHCDAILP
jgi:hypothetical protein